MNLAILSLSDPDTARGLASPPAPPGEEERELPVGGVKLDLVSAGRVGLRLTSWNQGGMARSGG